MEDNIKKSIVEMTACCNCSLFYECEIRKTRVKQNTLAKCDLFVFEHFQCPKVDDIHCENCIPWKVCNGCTKLSWCGGASPCMIMCSLHSKNNRYNKYNHGNEQHLELYTYLKCLEARIIELEKPRFIDGHVFETDRYNNYLSNIKKNVINKRK